MKHLQNNFTTLEQSNRLLELGVPAWTADCYYYEEGGISKDCTPNIIPLGEVWIDESKETMFSSYVDVPCWSVGRLIEIILICHIGKAHIYFDTTLYEISYASNMDWVIRVLESAIKCKRINFSKLEE